MSLTPEEREELGELAQWCHAHPRQWFAFGNGVEGWKCDTDFIAKALDELARLQVALEQLRAALKEAQDEIEDMRIEAMEEYDT